MIKKCKDKIWNNHPSINSAKKKYLGVFSAIKGRSKPTHKHSFICDRVQKSP